MRGKFLVNQTRLTVRKRIQVPDVQSSCYQLKSFTKSVKRFSRPTSEISRNCHRLGLHFTVFSEKRFVI